MSLILHNINTNSMEKKVAPVKPNEVTGLKQQAIPAAVTESFNTLIIQNFKSGSARVVQKDVEKLIIEKGISRQDIYQKNWMDIEDIYRKNGWDVKYNSPCRDENFDSYFLFSVKTK